MSYKTRENGQSMVEYTLIVVLIALVLVLVLALLGSQLSIVFSQLVSYFPD